MATLTFSSTKSFFLRLTDIFQKRDNAPISLQHAPKAEHIESVGEAQTEHVKTKLNINLSDLKIVSTALLHYRRTLSKQGDLEKAEGVERIDKQFYELIQMLEARNAA